MTFIRVVLPDPLLPTTAQFWPFSIDQVMADRIFCSFK